MEDYKVLYIDEEQKARDAFARFIDGEFKSDIIEPLESMDDLIDYIHYSSPDAVIVDHRLAEFMPVITYDGTDVVRHLKQLNPNFPVFILTAHDGEAIEVADDVNYVYPKMAVSQKGKKNENEDGFKLIDRIRMQIRHYLSVIASAENELEILIKKAEKEALNADEESRLIQLDTLLHDQIGRDLDIPEHLKTKLKADKTLELINVTQQLMDAIKR